MVSPPSADLLMSLVKDQWILGYESLGVNSPVLDSVSVLDIFTDQARIPNCETVFVSKSLAKSPVLPFVIIPKPKKGSSSGEEAEPVITIQAEGVTLLEDGVVCLHLRPGLNKNMSIKNVNFIIVMVEMVTLHHIQQ